MPKSKLNVRVPAHANVEKEVSGKERFFYACASVICALGGIGAASEAHTIGAVICGAGAGISFLLACKRYRKLD